MPSIKHKSSAKYAKRNIQRAALSCVAESLEPRRLLASGLVGAYGFEENAGSTVADASGSGNTGTITAATWTTVGKYGNALSFNGTSAFVTVNDSASLHLTTGMTLEAWVYPTIASGTRDVLIKQGTNVDIYNMYSRDDAGLPEGNVFVGSTNHVATGSALPANTWSFMTASYDGTNLQLYINGTLVKSAAVGGSIGSSTGVLRIGGNSLWGEYFQGMIDEVRVYNRALSTSEIATDMATPVSASIVDTTPPIVGTITPPNGATNVSTGTSVTVRFSEAMNPANINSTNFELRNGANQFVPANVTYNASTLTATLNPTGALALRTDFYTARVHGGVGGVTDVAGNLLAADYTWQFSTQAPVFQNQTFIGTGLTAPTVMLWLPGGRMLIAGLFGTVWVVQPGHNTVDSTPVLQITNIDNTGVSDGAENGLNGMTIDPNFSSNGFIYIFYTAKSPNHDRVSRFTMTGNTATLASEKVLWQETAALMPDHHGGALAFGPDGKLYITVGEQDNPQSAQSLTSYHGKVLRINSDGTIPTDNPFYDGNGSNLDAIWALGLRNPFHMSFDASGKLYIGNVGGNDVNQSWEEIYIGVAGANYGWPVFEGNTTLGGYTNPWFTYPHAGRDACVVAGFIYSGSSYPSAFKGDFFYGDYARNYLRRLTVDANGNVSGDYPFDPADGTADLPAEGDPVCIVQGPDGDLYYIDIGFQDIITGVNGGPVNPPTNPSIRRLHFVGGNLPPVVSATATPNIGQPPLTVNFSSAGTFDPEGQSLTYLWDFGDGATSTALNPTHVYNVAGPYFAQLTVSDGVNSTPSSILGIAVGTPPVATITSPAAGSPFIGGQVINFSGTGFDQEDGNLPASAFSWTIVFHHDTHIHPVLGPLTGVTSGSVTVPVTGHDFHDQTSYEILLTVTDSTGLQNTTSVTIYPDKVNLTFASTPPGSTVLVDGLPETTPFVLDSLKNFQHTIQAVTPITIGANQYNFVSWSDGGANPHTVVTPTTDLTYTANYVAAGPPGPVASYNFDEGTGTTATDDSGHGNTGSITGATWTTTGKFGGALSFNGTNNLVSVADAASLELTTGLTLEAWVNPTTTSGVRDVIIKEGPNVDYYNLYERNGSGRPEGNVFVGGGNKTAQGTALPANTWSFMTSTYDGTTLSLYINGTLAASTAVSGPISTSNGFLRIGGNNLWGEFFQGMIDNVRIYNRALTPAAIQTDMTTGVPSPSVNHPPVAKIIANPTSGTVPLTVNLDGTTSSDPDGDSLAYAWDLNGDGAYDDSVSPTASVIFSSAGIKTIGLQVTDTHGATSTTSTQITVSDPNNTPPNMFIDTPSNALPWKVGDTISFSGHATDQEEGSIHPAGINWQVILHQGATATVLQTFTGLDTGTFVVPNESYPSTLEFKATATDSGGLQSTASVTVNPQTVSLNFATSPGGLQLTVDSVTSTTPFSRTVIVNSTNPVIAISPQTLNSTNYFFSSWSDAGLATHAITAPVAGTTYTANYAVSSGPIAAYNFNAGSGTVLADISGNGNNGTITAATWTTSGKSGSALSFNGTSAMVTIPDAASLHLSTGMTLEAWVYPTVTNGVRDVLIKEGTGIDIYNMYARNGAGRPEGNVFVSGANKTAQGATALGKNSWAHLAATYDGTSLKLYVNGTLATTTAVSGSIATSTGALRIGGNSIWGEFFQGRIDDVRIYNRALSAAEVTTDMTTPVTAPAVVPALAATTTVSTPATPPTRTAVFGKTRIGSVVDLIEIS